MVDIELLIQLFGDESEMEYPFAEGFDWKTLKIEKTSNMSWFGKNFVCSFTTNSAIVYFKLLIKILWVIRDLIGSTFYKRK